MEVVSIDVLREPQLGTYSTSSVPHRSFNICEQCFCRHTQDLQHLSVMLIQTSTMFHVTVSHIISPLLVLIYSCDLMQAFWLARAWVCPFRCGVLFCSFEHGATTPLLLSISAKAPDVWSAEMRVCQAQLPTRAACLLELWQDRSWSGGLFPQPSIS